MLRLPAQRIPHPPGQDSATHHGCSSSPSRKKKPSGQQTHAGKSLPTAAALHCRLSYYASSRNKNGSRSNRDETQFGLYCAKRSLFEGTPLLTQQLGQSANGYFWLPHSRLSPVSAFGLKPALR